MSLTSLVSCALISWLNYQTIILICKRINLGTISYIFGNWFYSYYRVILQQRLRLQKNISRPTLRPSCWASWRFYLACPEVTRSVTPNSTKKRKLSWLLKDFSRYFLFLFFIIILFDPVLFTVNVAGNDYPRKSLNFKGCLLPNGWKYMSCLRIIQAE